MDLLIHGGMIVDGTGNPGYRGAVAVDGDRLRVIRGSIDTLTAKTRLDATGRVVAPGFIDMHSHSGLSLLHDPLHEAKVRQGVTTEVIGVDGCSYAPFQHSTDLENFARLNAGLDGRLTSEDRWHTVAEYLSRLDAKAAVNTVFLIGNSALRICVVGWADRVATDAEVEDMRALLREGMSEGAFGLSTGLDYPPGAYASTDELVAISADAAAMGGIYHTHVRYQLGDGFLDPFREAIEIGRRSDVPVHVTHLYRRQSASGGSASLLDIIETARADGLDVTFDTYPYQWSSTRLLILLPMWLQDGGPDPLMERLSDPSLRPRIREEVDRRASAYGGHDVWERIHVGAFIRPQNHDHEGQTIATIAKSRGQHPADAMCDLLVAEDLGINQVAANPDPASLPRFLSHPLAMVGSDSVFAGERPSPRTYGTFPRILGDLVRGERLISLPDAVRKMTSYPAQRLGIADRGLVRDGMKADLVVFDPDTVRALATYESPRQYPVGIDHVIVNGQAVLLNGQMTGGLPGRALRHRQPDR
jgi:N-acyl-D-amino-acid deacylase